MLPGFGKTYQSTEDIASYHAHVYYDGGTKQHAGDLRREMDKRFDVELGRWRDKAIGPHPMSSFQVTFTKDQFVEIMPFLALNRESLFILVHPNTGDGFIDHTDNAMWVGPSVPLNAEWMKRNQDRLQRAAENMVVDQQK